MRDLVRVPAQAVANAQAHLAADIGEKIPHMQPAAGAPTSGLKSDRHPVVLARRLDHADDRAARPRRPRGGAVTRPLPARRDAPPVVRPRVEPTPAEIKALLPIAPTIINTQKAIETQLTQMTDLASTKHRINRH